MILISRALIRQFRSVLRQAGFYKARAPQSCGVRMVFDAESMRIQADNGHVAVQLQRQGGFESAEFTVPLAFFTECEGKPLELVTIHRDDTGRTVADWIEHDVPQQAIFPPLAPPDIPEFAAERIANPPCLLEALRDTAPLVSLSPTRYALDCLLLKGKSGAIVATDSRQLLSVEGFSFPWEDDLLLQVSGIFHSKELPSKHDVEIGRTESGVTIQIGPWTIHHRINQDGRYPDLTKVIPAQSAIRTSLRLDLADAEVLLERSEQLPGSDITDRPVTLDLNGAATIRVRRDDETPTMELVLSRSQRLGDEMRICTNRDYLTRALRFGFRDLDFVNPESPCVCRDGDRTFIWMPLEKSGILPPDPEAIRLESANLSAPRPHKRLVQPGTRRARRQRTVTNADCAGPLNGVSMPQVQRQAGDPGFLTRVHELQIQLENTVRNLSELLTELPQTPIMPGHALSA